MLSHKMTMNEAFEYIDGYGGLFPIIVAQQRYDSLLATYNSVGLCTKGFGELKQLGEAINIYRSGPTR